MSALGILRHDNAIVLVPGLVGDRLSSVTEEGTYLTNLPNSLGLRVPARKDSSTCKVCQHLLAPLAK